MKLINILLEQQDPSAIIRELDSYAAEFEDKLYTYSDEDLVRVKGRLEDLLVSKATDAETLLQNIADFVDDILGVGDEMVYIFDILEKLHDLDLFDFYSQVEDIVRRLIEHIEGNVMYDRSHQVSGVD